MGGQNISHYADDHWKHKYPPLPSLKSLGLDGPEKQRKSGEDLAKMKKFRFHLLHDWMITHFSPCRVADIGGGKGLLSYLLQKSGWDATVVDPYSQHLPPRYRDPKTGERVRIARGESVPRIDRPFEPGMAKDFDLLVGLHAHGSNMKIIEAAAKSGCGFVLLPCCVIDEPATPAPGVHWLEWLADYATGQGHEVSFFKLNFKGQRIGFYSTVSK